jgi:hypothetical protein
VTDPEPAVADDRSAAPGSEPTMTGVVGRAFRLLLTNPRETMLPMLAIQFPLSVIVAGITVALYLTVFRNEPIDRLNQLLTSDGHRGQQFMVLALEGASALFTLVAFGATVASVAACLRGRRLPLPQALDPAFTRMGGLLAIGGIELAAVIPVVIPFVGIFLAIYTALRLALILPVYMVEGARLGQATRRSWSLMRGNRMTLLGLGMVSVGFIAVPGLLLGIGGSRLLGDGRTAVVIGNGLLAVLNGVLLVPMLSFAVVALTLFYFDVSTKEATGRARI